MNRRRFFGVIASSFAGVAAWAKKPFLLPAASASQPTFQDYLLESECGNIVIGTYGKHGNPAPPVYYVARVIGGKVRSIEARDVSAGVNPSEFVINPYFSRPTLRMADAFRRMAAGE